MQALMDTISAINNVIWHDYVLYIVLGVGILFTIWSGFCQYRALTHGVAVTKGKYDDPDDPGAISHFQALSAALSATVGLGNIGGVAVAIALGGPGAVFWMWVIGLFGMALKTTEVTLSMLYRNTDDPDNPHGGPMWVASKGLAERGFGPAGKFLGGLFCVTLLVSAFTGGNMFQAWNVGIVTENASNGSIPTVATGIVLAIIVGAVIIGGIKRIGAVAGKLVPLMCALYLLAAFYVLFLTIGEVPRMLVLIVKHAFTPLEAQGAFVGGTFGYAFLWGMKRALFSSESGQGSSPIAHSAAKTKEPVREGVVAGLEPFIDTIVVCTLTALVILCSGAWNRAGETAFETTPAFTQVDGNWTLGTTTLPSRNTEAMRVARNDWRGGENVFVNARWGDIQEDTNDNITRVNGSVEVDGDSFIVVWESVEANEQPVLINDDIYAAYPSAALTTHAFNIIQPGMGTWLVLLASWLFAISTMISWSYYGEQGMVYLLGEKSVLPYKLVYCLLIIVSTMPFIQTDSELDALTSLGTGVMLWANIPIMLIFGAVAMKAYHAYGAKLKAGEFDNNDAPSSSNDES
ncbi:MAG: amino acid carrier protein [Planctomycetota bacterium]|nr:amino acid carrier protein [Planctomycetota bacterium]